MQDKIRILEAKIEMYHNSSIPERIKEGIIEKLQEEIKIIKIKETDGTNEH